MSRSSRPRSVFPISVRRLEVSRVLDVAPGLRRITLTGDQLGAFTTADGIDVPALRSDGFDDHVKVFVPEPGQTEVRPARQVHGHLDWSGVSAAKDYTPRRWDARAGELDLEFVLHGTGPAATWAARARPGDAAHIAGPKMSEGLPVADWLLVGGDETAIPAIGRLLDDLPTTARAQVLVEVADAAHEVPIPGLATRPGVELTWLHRDGAAPGTSAVLEKALRSLEWWPGSVFAWFAGEATTLKPIRAYLRHERGLPAEQVQVAGYWRRAATRPEPALSVEGAVESPVDTPAEAAAEAADDVNPWVRLESLLDLTAPAALRAFARLGLLERLDAGPASVPALAAEQGLDPVATHALLRYLDTLGIVAVTADQVALGPLGEALAEADDVLVDLVGGGAGVLLDLTPEALATAVRTGARVGGVPARLAADPVLAAGQRARRGEAAAWAAPSVVSHHDWARHATALVVGQGAPEVAAVLLREHPGLVVTAAVVPPETLTARVVLGVNLLDQHTDAEAVEILRELVDGLPVEEDEEARLLLAELVLDESELHDHDAALDLQLRTAFGSGMRTSAEWHAVFAAAGLTVAEDQELGWDLRMWALR